MTNTTTPRVGGGGVPRANKVPSTVVDASELFLGSNSRSLPNISSPTLKNFTDAFKDMSNLTTFPSLNLPTVHNMNRVFEGCPNLTGKIPYTGFYGDIVWDYAFSDCPKITHVPIEFFRMGSTYVRTFNNCTGLLSLTDQSKKDTFEFPGLSHLNTFRGCTNFTLPLSNTTGTAIRFTFQDSTTIAGCFGDTNALGSTSVVRYSFELTADRARYADVFINNPKASASTHKFANIKIRLPRAAGAQNLLGPATLTEGLILEVLTPDNGDGANHNILTQLVVSGGAVNLRVTRDDYISDMCKYISIPIMDTLKYYMWNDITIENIDVTMEVMNDLQKITVLHELMFTGCTFINPTGLGTLQDTGGMVTFYCYGCTGISVLSNCLSGNHQIRQ